MSKECKTIPESPHLVLLSWILCAPRFTYCRLRYGCCLLGYEWNFCGNLLLLVKAGWLFWTRRIARAFVRIVLKIQKFACRCILKKYTILLPYITLFLYVKAPPFLGTSFVHDSENSVLRVMCIRRFMALLPPSREAGKKNLASWSIQRLLYSTS